MRKKYCGMFFDDDKRALNMQYNSIKLKAEKYKNL